MFNHKLYIHLEYVSLIKSILANTRRLCDNHNDVDYIEEYSNGNVHKSNDMQ